ncbi:hypothetical protein [Eubacterium limosum]|uniref:hypothetical protein n=1 Tax=Eubacterium limosum TaxID=1736 RepID=UPI00371F5EF6
MIEEVLKDLTAAIRENTEELARQSALVKELIPMERNVTLNVQEVGAAVSTAILNDANEGANESQEPEAPPVVEDNGVAVISEEQKAALRKEGIRIKKAGKVSDFKKVLTDYQYEKVSDIKVKDYDEILEITKSIK